MKKSAHRKMVSAFIFSFQKAGEFSHSRKVLLLFQKFLGFGKSCDYHWGFTIGVAVLACGSIE